MKTYDEMTEYLTRAMLEENFKSFVDDVQTLKPTQQVLDAVTVKIRELIEPYVRDPRKLRVVVWHEGDKLMCDVEGDR